MSELSARQFEIMEAAAKLLTHRGINGLTIKNLASEMEFTESAVYRHFSSKEAIILQLLNWVKQTMRTHESEINMAAESPILELQELFKRKFFFFNEHPYLAAAVFSDGLLEESQDITASILEIMAGRRNSVLALISQAQQKGCLRADVEAAQLTHFLMGSVRLLIFNWRMGGFAFDIRQAGEQVVHSFIQLTKPYEKLP